jgi:hypothetical protein
MKVTLDLSHIAHGQITLVDVNPVTLIDELEHAYHDDPALGSALATVAHLIGASNGGTATNRSNHNWNATPERRFFKCVLGVLVRQGLARNELLLKFTQLVPDYQQFFDHPVTDAAIWGRADTGRRARYRSEHPDVSPLTLPYWGIAQEVVARDKPMTADEVRVLMTSVHVDVPEPTSPEQPETTGPADDQPKAEAASSVQPEAQAAE